MSIFGVFPARLQPRRSLAIAAYLCPGSLHRRLCAGTRLGLWWLGPNRPTPHILISYYLSSFCADCVWWSPKWGGDAGLTRHPWGGEAEWVLPGFPCFWDEASKKNFGPRLNKNGSPFRPHPHTRKRFSGSLKFSLSGSSLGQVDGVNLGRQKKCVNEPFAQLCKWSCTFA